MSLNNASAPVKASESLLAGILLALTGGFLDAYTYVCRGGVFANAQTGNMVLMAIRAIERDWLGVLKYLAPVAAFAAGVFAAEIIRVRFRTISRLHWRQIVLGLEIIFLAAAAFIPDSSAQLNQLVNVLVSFICALQVDSFRKLYGSAYATTMCTGNLRSGSEQLVLYIRKKDKWHLASSLRYYGIIVVFCIGGAVGGLLTQRLGVISALSATLPLVLLFFWLRRDRAVPAASPAQDIVPAQDS